MFELRLSSDLTFEVAKFAHFGAFGFTWFLSSAFLRSP